MGKIVSHDRKDTVIAFCWFSLGLLLLTYGFFGVPRFLENGVLLLFVGIVLLCSGVFSLWSELRTDESEP